MILPNYVVLLVVALLNADSKSHETVLLGNSVNTDQNAFPFTEDPNEAYLSNLDKALTKWVSATGNVDYKSISADADFALALKTIKTMIPDKTWTRDQQMSFWINAYNVFTIQLICDHYPVKSIQDIPMPWDALIVELKDKKYSLNQVENTILRPKFNDARIHFAINCAAKSCPPLYNHAFRAENLNKTLTKLNKDFINNSLYNQITTHDIKISKIFEWYKDDFASKQTLIAYLNIYSNVPITTGAKIGYLEYDWSLNKK